MTTSRQIKRGIPETDDLLHISHAMSSSWMELAEVLGFHEAELAQLTLDYPDSFEQCYQMLVRWLHKGGSQANYEVLAKALKHPLVNKQDLALQFCFKTKCFTL